MRFCGLRVEMPGCRPDGKCQRHQRQKSTEISRCLRPETLPFVCQMLETDGARWDFAWCRHHEKSIERVENSLHGPQTRSQVHRDRVIRGAHEKKKKKKNTTFSPSSRFSKETPCRARILCIEEKKKRKEHTCANWTSSDDLT